MKRFSERIRKLIKKYTWQKSVTVFLGVIMGIVGAIWLFCFADKTSATSLDYEPFEKQIVAIQEDRMFITDGGDITIEDGVIVIALENVNRGITIEDGEISFKLSNSNGNVTIKDEVITVTSQNSKCGLITKLDLNFNVLDTPTKVDLSNSMFMIIICTIGFGFSFSILVAMLSWVLLWFLYFLVWWLPKEIYKSCKSKK